MEGKILFIALVLGIVFGSLMLCCLLLVYIKHKKFGFGSFVLTLFGVMLLGFSIWMTAEISVTLAGKIEANFQALTKQVGEIREVASSTTAKIEEIDKAQNSVIREIMNVKGSIIPEGDIEAKFEALTKQVEEIDKTQNSVIREIMNLQSYMYQIKDHTKYHEVPRRLESKPQNDLYVRE
jgi:prefoldin subunit 5